MLNIFTFSPPYIPPEGGCGGGSPPPHPPDKAARNLDSKHEVEIGRKSGMQVGLRNETQHPRRHLLRRIKILPLPCGGEDGGEGVAKSTSPSP